MTPVNLYIIKTPIYCYCIISTQSLLCTAKIILSSVRIKDCFRQSHYAIIDEVEAKGSGTTSIRKKLCFGVRIRC